VKRPLLLLLLLAAAATRAQSPSGGASVPAKNWELPIFTKEGFRSLTLRGTEVRPGGVGRIDVTDISITTFVGGANARVDTVLLSPAATFRTKENLASGDQSVRLIRDDLEVTGEDWTYDHAAKKVSIARHTRVVFRAQLNDILK
jgi:hypothetical protein